MGKIESDAQKVRCCWKTTRGPQQITPFEQKNVVGIAPMRQMSRASIGTEDRMDATIFEQGGQNDGPLLYTIQTQITPNCSRTKIPPHAWSTFNIRLISTTCDSNRADILKSAKHELQVGSEHFAL